jgi:alpha-D-ribose 1-methylphosphonate 5-triphosphate synthase subunit PhnH
VATAAPLHRGTIALLLALADFETPLWLSPPACNDAVLGAIRFHCGSPIVTDPSRAAFVVAANAAERPRLDALDLGSDLYPERAATLILQVDGLGVGREIVLAGPGIDGTARLAVDGLDEAFWAERNALEILSPRGLDVILVDGEAVAAIPRSTAVEA